MSTPRIPPPFVPTLTTVIEATPETASISSVQKPADAGAPSADSHRPGEEEIAFDEALVHRVMERVDRSLENQISDVVAAEVQAQLDAMVPRLRGEIEKVLRRLVTEALAAERADHPGSTLV